MNLRTVLATALLIGWPVVGRAAIPGRANPDWPCQSIKVEHLSIATLWNGPPIDPYLHTWSQDAEVAGLVHDLSQRRIPIEQAQSEITNFSKRAGADKQQRLLKLMAGLFDTLDQERASVVAGLDRFGARQRHFADELRASNAKLHDLQASASSDSAGLEQAGNQLAMQLRVFETQRQSLSYACNVPTSIEQRVFALARAIQQEIGG